MLLFDSHCHINDEKLLPEVEEVVSRAENRGVRSFLCIAWNYESSLLAVRLAEAHENVYAAIGVHPENYKEETPETIDKIRELSKHPKVVAIGEIGLDYHWENDPETKTAQKEWFIRQIELANELDLPASIHGRDASQDLYDILKAHPIKRGFVLHCYSGSPEMMKEFAKLGAYFGFDGPITYKNAVQPKECVAQCPLDRLLIETDCPYLPPVPHRGERNEPSYVVEIFKTMALLRNIGEDELEKRLNENYVRLFGKKVMPR